jgi:type IV secretory pathway TrbD component
MSAHSTSPSSRAGGRPVLPLIVIGIAVAMQLVVAVPFTVGLGLLAPLWAIVVGWALWLVAAGALVVTLAADPWSRRWCRSRTPRCCSHSSRSASRRSAGPPEAVRSTNLSTGVTPGRRGRAVAAGMR